MPATDQCEPQIIRALQKEGWVVTHKPFSIRTEEEEAHYVYADLRLRQTQNRQTIIVTEVKCFPETRPMFEEMYQAIGQYVIYRNALALNEIPAPLYLAIPLEIYTTFFQKPVIQASIKDVKMNLFVVDLENEEIISWIP